MFEDRTWSIIGRVFLSAGLILALSFAGKLLAVLEPASGQVFFYLAGWFSACALFSIWWMGRPQC